MAKTPKEQLSEHVENIFKGYVEPGLHVCDLATGGGKSYTIGKLTCEYYPDHFDRIIILCVQNKLIDGMLHELNKFVDGNDSKVEQSDILVIENNPEVIYKAIKSHSFERLLEQMRHRIDEEERRSRTKLREPGKDYHRIVKIHAALTQLISLYDSKEKNDYIQKQIGESESSLRNAVRSFFESYRRYRENVKKEKRTPIATIKREFPALEEVYPQVDFRSKKILLMTVHKAMYGIDPILSEKVNITDFAEKNKKTLIILDESDQAAVAMRKVIIDQAADAVGNRRFAKGYNGFLQYRQLLDASHLIDNGYHGEALEKALNNARASTRKNWSRVFGETEPFKNIFLDKIDNIEDYRRGVFFSGPIVRLNVSNANDKSHSYVCYKKGERCLRLAHSDNEDELKNEYQYVVPLHRFLMLSMGNTTAIMSQLRRVIVEALDNSRNKFEQEERNVANNTASSVNYLGYPTLEREIHTLFSRFETTSEYQFEQQVNDFITNRKNIAFINGDKQVKLPDYSVYSQGFSLYQEEIDERDNQHRVRLSCREIQTTPEKIIVDLCCKDGTSLVLCSATASNRSVVSNFDVQYLKQVLGNRYRALNECDARTFDELVAKTYPEGHDIEIIPIQHHTFGKIPESKMSLPDKYRDMFCQEARDEGLPEKWFRCTKRELLNEYNGSDSITFHLYRLLQFIEAYSWFMKEDGVRSMLYFQNRTGDKDRRQIQTLSCLIDGSYKKMKSGFDDTIPSDWTNEHIRITKESEEVEDIILPELSNDKSAKIMFVSAYNSFKAGANLQYQVPEGLDYLAGDNWDADGENVKKDWDAVFLQSPTSYLTMTEDGTENTFEKSLYNVMLTLMMLMERGCLCAADVSQWLCKALSGTIWFSEKTNIGVADDKAAWAQSVIEQAVGRLCRTRNKPKKTCILYDETMSEYFTRESSGKSMTLEFRTLAAHIEKNIDSAAPATDSEEVRCCNDANNVKATLNRIRSSALKYAIHKNEDPDIFDTDNDNGNEVPHIVRTAQLMLSKYKSTIIRKPVLSSLDDLSADDRMMTVIDKCYGKWKRNDDGSFNFHWKDGRIAPNGKEYTMSPAEVRLDVLMKNEVIRQYFEENGYATEWEPGEYILHPDIFAYDYTGEIGEEAFKAIVSHYTDCGKDELVHLEGRDYELADFVIKRPDGTNRIAFDVKNMRPDFKHDDKVNDVPTAEKRSLKKDRLGCELITVNILQIPGQSMDDIHEIGGIIDGNGKIIQSAIDRIIKYVNGK